MLSHPRARTAASAGPNSAHTPSAATRAACFALALLAGCSGSDGGVEPPGGEPATIEILSPASQGSYAVGSVALIARLTNVTPDELIVELDGVVQDVAFVLDQDLVTGTLQIESVGMHEVEVRNEEGATASASDVSSFEAVDVPPVPSADLLFEILGDVENAFFGQAADGLPDIDGDGSDDFIVGARAYSGVVDIGGRADVISSRTGLSLMSILGDTGEALGTSVADAGDIDGDGVHDVVIGAPNSSATFERAGSVFVVSSANGQVLFRKNGEAKDDVLGVSVAGLGDVNNDGVLDFGAGGTEAAYAGFKSGRVRVYSGADGSELYHLDGDSSFVQLGIALDGAGDIDEDGSDDFIVGEWGAKDNGASSGAALVVSGADGSTIWRVAGDVADDHLGVDVAAGRDLDNDGINDFLAGAWEASPLGLDKAGYARAYSGADGSVLFTINGETQGIKLGGSVDFCGDMDGDGFLELVIGAPFYGGVRGAAQIHSGADGALLARVIGPPALALFGQRVAGTGDLNADGRPDFVVGAPLEVVDGIPLGSLRAFTLPLPTLALETSLAPEELCDEGGHLAGFDQGASGGFESIDRGNLVVDGGELTQYWTAILIAIDDSGASHELARRQLNSMGRASFGPVERTEFGDFEYEAWIVDAHGTRLRSNRLRRD